VNAEAAEPSCRVSRRRVVRGSGSKTRPVPLARLRAASASAAASSRSRRARSAKAAGRKASLQAHEGAIDDLDHLAGLRVDMHLPGAGGLAEVQPHHPLQAEIGAHGHVHQTGRRRGAQVAGGAHAAPGGVVGLLLVERGHGGRAVGVGHGVGVVEGAHDAAVALGHRHDDLGELHRDAVEQLLEREVVRQQALAPADEVQVAHDVDAEVRRAGVQERARRALGRGAGDGRPLGLDEDLRGIAMIDVAGVELQPGGNSGRGDRGDQHQGR
jgi:hypothetical protein